MKKEDCKEQSKEQEEIWLLENPYPSFPWNEISGFTPQGLVQDKSGEQNLYKLNLVSDEARSIIKGESAGAGQDTNFFMSFIANAYDGKIKSYHTRQTNTNQKVGLVPFNLCLLGQPDVLDTFLNEPIYAETGCSSRFLIFSSLPRKLVHPDSLMSEDTQLHKNQYYDVMTVFLNHTEKLPTQIVYTEKARKQFAELKYYIQTDNQLKARHAETTERIDAIAMRLFSMLYIWDKASTINSNEAIFKQDDKSDNTAPIIKKPTIIEDLWEHNTGELWLFIQDFMRWYIQHIKYLTDKSTDDPRLFKVLDFLHAQGAQQQQQHAQTLIKQHHKAVMWVIKYPIATAIAFTLSILTTLALVITMWTQPDIYIDPKNKDHSLLQQMVHTTHTINSEVNKTKITTHQLIFPRKETTPYYTREVKFTPENPSNLELQGNPTLEIVITQTPEQQTAYRLANTPKEQ